MRTTLDIDDDVLAAAKDIARSERRTMGEVISDLARKALTQPSISGMAEAGAIFDADDFPTLPKRGNAIITTELVRQIQDDIDLEDLRRALGHELDRPRMAPETTRRKTRPKPV